MFHPIGKDEMLLSVASDIEVLTATNVLIDGHFDDYFVLSFRLFDPMISKKKLGLITSNDFPSQHAISRQCDMYMKENLEHDEYQKEQKCKLILELWYTNQIFKNFSTPSQHQ
jgi:hypothetical protein